MSIDKSKSFTIIIFTIILVIFSRWYIFLLILESIYIYKFIYDSRIIYLSLIISLSLIILSISASTPLTKTCVISEVRSTYHIADCNGKAILYELGEDVSLKDKIKVSGDFKEINSKLTLNNSNDNYYKSIEVSSYMNVKSYKIVENSSHISSLIYEKSKSNELYSKYLYNLADDFFLSVGIQYITLISIISKLLSDFVSDKTKRLISICICILISTLINSNMVLIRIIISNIVYIIFKDKCKYLKSTVIFMILFIIFPNYVYSLSFAYYFIFKLLTLYYNDIPNKIRSFFTISYMNLYYFNEIIPIRYLLFSYLRYLYCFNYLLVVISLSINIDIVYYFDHLLNVILDISNSIVIFGSLNDLSIIIVLYMFLYCFNFYSNKKLVILITSVAILPYLPLFKPYYDIYYVNVGQGDSIIINSPYNLHTLVIDNPSNSKETSKTLKALGIKNIDELVISHDDLDHSGGVELLCDEFKVKRIHNNKRKAIKTTTYEIKLLLQDKKYSDKNKNSTIMYLRINDISYLFTGDIDEEVEKDLIRYYPNLKVDVLKVAHHGSKTSTSKEFVAHVLPKLSIVSVSKNNMYHHPSIDVLNNLEGYNSNILLTSKDGSINIKSFPFITYFITSRKQIGLL